MAKRRTPVGLPDVLQRVITGLELESGLRPFRVIQVWESVVGPLLGPHTRATDCRQGVVFAEARSAAFMNELALGKSRILERLREKVPGLVVTDLRVRLGGGFPSLRREMIEAVPSAAALAAAEQALSDVRDPEVRAFLARAFAAQTEFHPVQELPAKDGTPES